MSAIALTIVAIALGATDPEPCPDLDRWAQGPAVAPFGMSRLAPPDVTFFLHIEDAAAVRREIGPRPIAGALEGVLTPTAEAAWIALARQAGTDPATLFDDWLGRDLTLLIRDRSGDDGVTRRDWTLVTRLPADSDAVMKKLNPHRLAPRGGTAVAELPEHDLVLAIAGDAKRDDAILVVGPRGGGLFDAVVTMIGAAGPPGAPGAAEPAARLADDPALVKASTLGSGHAGFFVRHAEPLGGWSVGVARLDGARMLVRHASSFANPPFDRPIVRSRWDVSIIDTFEDMPMLAIAEPTEIGEGNVERFGQALLGAPLMSERMRRNCGDCRVFTLGEVEGRQEERPIDLLLPAGALVIRIKDPAEAERELDIHLTSLVRRAAAIAQERAAGGEGAPAPALIEVPEPGAFKPGEVRRVDLAPIMDRIGGGVAFFRSLTLNWTVTTGPSGSFYVIATHPGHLAETVRAIEHGAKRPRRIGKWSNVGTLDGGRVGRHLAAWEERAELLAADDDAAADAFRETVRLLSELAAGVERCRWKLARPAANEMDLEVEVHFAAPESSQ